MYLTSLQNTEKTKVDMAGAVNVYKQIPISKAVGSPAYSFRVFTIEPDGHTPYHTHSFEHLNYVISGHGTLVGKDNEYEIKQGDFALVLPDETHQYRNTSAEEPLIIICAVPKEYE